MAPSVKRQQYANPNENLIKLYTKIRNCEEERSGNRRTCETAILNISQRKKDADRSTTLAVRWDRTIFDCKVRMVPVSAEI